ANFSDAGTGTIFDYSQSGLAENVVPLSGFVETTIFFPVSFPSPPRVTANLANFDNDAAIVYIVQIKTVTTDNFTIKTFVDYAVPTGDADIIWYATVASQSGGRE
ncbi:MAG: H-type lectin domain-containing protein, partial [Candidatus Hadarchaeaceae archaeon]